MNSLWDSELQSLERDVVQLRRQADRMGDPKEFDAVTSLRSDIDEALGALAVNHDRVLQIARRNHVVGRAHSTILYWAKQHMTRLKILADEFIGLQNRKMWLHLLQARFSGVVGVDQSTLEAKHLVDLVVRRQHLSRIEQALREDLDAVGAHRQKLRDEYEKIGTADENWHAAGSMHGRLGVNIQDAAEHPSTKEITTYMKTLAIPLRHPDEDAWLAQINGTLERKSSNILDQCKSLAAGFVQSGSEAINRNALNQFKNAINQLNILNDQVHETLEKLMDERIAPARPKLVQKTPKQVKTEDRSAN